MSHFLTLFTSAGSFIIGQSECIRIKLKRATKRYFCRAKDIKVLVLECVFMCVFVCLPRVLAVMGKMQLSL